MDIKKLKKIPPWDWPADTDKEVLAILRDRGADAETRLAAANLAGDYTIIGEPLVAALLDIVGDSQESAALRAASAIALGPVLEHADASDFDEPDDPISERTFKKIRKRLHALFDDTTVPMEVRRRILEAAVRASRPWQVEPIRAAWASNDPKWKLTAVFCMRFVRGFSVEILEALKSGDKDIHFEAVNAAGSWSVKGAWRHVSELAVAPKTKKSLRLAAIDAVAQIRPRKAHEVLEPLLSCGDEEIEEAVEEALSYAAMGEGEF